jgi:Ca2+-transporting ATPase
MFKTDGLVKILVGVAIASASFSISEVWDDIFNENEEIRSTVLQSLVEPGIIIAILLLNAAVGVWQDVQARSSLESLEKMQPRLATVLRHHHNHRNATIEEEEDDTTAISSSLSEWIAEYDATKLVPGDVIKLKVGRTVPADARLGILTSATMYVDESSLTGESLSVGKSPGDEGLIDVKKEDNHGGGGDGGEGEEKLSIPIQLQSMMLFSGSLVTRGSGIALVVRTGTATQMGTIRSTLVDAQIEEEERRTPLGVQLDEFGTKLSYIIGGICLAVWIASIPRFSDSAFNTWLDGALYYAKVGVALGVAAIPEGLPAVITLCLSLGTRRMAEKNVIVRKLPSVETLGCTSVICTDKTGTLTTNQMTAVSFILLERTSDGLLVAEHDVQGNSYNPAGYVEGIDRDETLRIPNGAVSEACRVCAMCNDARLIGVDEAYQYTIEGEPTEASLLALMEKLGPNAAANKSPEGEGSLKPSELASLNSRHVKRVWDRYATLEFDRQRKSMSVLCSRVGSDFEEEEEEESKLFVKGAPSMLLKRCTQIKTRDGNVEPLTSDLRDKIESTIGSLGNRALRCIGLAVKEGKYLELQLQKKGESCTEYLKDPSKYETIETGLTFVGMVAIRDPPRDGVAESIDKCEQAGIRVIMITGDAKQTAEAIAKDVHILNDQDLASPSSRAYEGREFFVLPESQQLETLKSGNLVICRCEPKDKKRLVKMLQSLHEIPAMTGDGVNVRILVISFVSPMLYLLTSMPPFNHRMLLLFNKPVLASLWAYLGLMSPKRPRIWSWSTTIFQPSSMR